MSLGYLRQGQRYQVEWSLCGLEYVHGNLEKLDEISKSTLSAQFIEISTWFLKDCRRKLGCVYMMPFSDRKSMVWLSLSLHSYAHADITNQLQTLSQSRQQLLFPDIRFRGAQNSSKHCSNLTLVLLAHPSLGHWTIFVSGTSIQEDFSSVNPLHFPFKIPSLLSRASQSLLVAAVYFF